MQNFNIDGMNIGYTGDGNDHRIWPLDKYTEEEISIDNVQEDLIIINGYASFSFDANWTYMPNQ